MHAKAFYITCAVCCAVLCVAAFCVVPSLLPVGSAVAGSAFLADTAQVNINTAPAAELQALPGIGEVTAHRIVQYRTEHGGFAGVQELVLVQGVSESKLENIAEYLCV